MKGPPAEVESAMVGNRLTESVRWAQAREVARLFGELIGHVSGAADFYGHFLERSTRLIGARVGVVLDTSPLQRKPLRLSVLSSWGWLNERQRTLFRRDASDHLYRANPFLQAFAEALNGRDDEQAVARRQLVRDRAWYCSPYINDTFRHLDLDDVVIGAVPLGAAGRWLWLAYLRAWGDRSGFSARERKVVLLLSTGLASAARTTRLGLRCWLPALALPRRLQQVRTLLLEGLSEKQIAGRLELSPGTIHRHVTRLYSELGITSRSEFFALALEAVRREACPFAERPCGRSGPCADSKR